MKYIWKTTILFLALALLSGCAVSHTYGPYMGKVLDAETEEPIEGAVLFMAFNTLSGNVGGTASHFADAKEVLTDKNGEFFLEHSITTLRPGQLWDPWPKTYIYKPGYGVFPGKGTSIIPKPDWYGIDENKYSIVKLPKLYTKKERLDALRHVSISYKVPYEKQRIIYDLRNNERIYLGLEPGWLPGSPWEPKSRGK